MSWKESWTHNNHKVRDRQRIKLRRKMWLQTRKHFIQQGFFMFHTTIHTTSHEAQKNSSLNHLMDNTFIFTLKWWLTDKQINTDTEWTPKKQENRKHRATRLNHLFLFFDPSVTPLAKNKTNAGGGRSLKRQRGLNDSYDGDPFSISATRKRALHPKKKEKKKKQKKKKAAAHLDYPGF